MPKRRRRFQFVNFALAALTELPSVFIGEFICNRIGRRWSHCLCMLRATLIFVAMTILSSGESTDICGWNLQAYCSVFAWADPSNGTLVTVLALCAKTVSNVGWFCNYLQNMEIFPTTARMSGLNITATFATVVGISAPYVILLGKTNIQLMYLIFVLFGVMGTVATR